MKLLFKIANKICILIKLVIYKIIFTSSIHIKSILKTNLSKTSKIIIEDKSSSITIGKNFTSREHVILRVCGGILNLGENIFLNNFVSINCMNKISIGNNCLFGENVKKYDHDHIFNRQTAINKQGFKCKEIKIGNNVWIGSNCTILKGVTIGDNSVIGAGTIVRSDIPSETVAYMDPMTSSYKIKYK